MILSKAEIDNIIINNPNKALIQRGRSYNVDMRRHFYGERIESALPVIEGYEKPTLRELRVKYAKSNKDLFNRISRPLDKVFNARGGSIYTNLTDEQDRKARAFMANIRGGMSIKKWNENFWKKHYMDDPYGVIFMEIEEEREARILLSKGRSPVYPTYKSIQCIYDYKPSGSELEYIVFTVDNHEKKELGLKPEDMVFRVVDDAQDAYYKKEGETVTKIPGFTLPNLFGSVPARTCSDIPDPMFEGGKLSIFEDIRELADTFLLKGSIKLTYEFLLEFPKYWQYADDCENCKGTGMQPNTVDEPCKVCNGSKKSYMSKVSDKMLLSHPQTKEDPTITPYVAGYVTPPIEFHNIAKEGLQLLEDLMQYTIWGASPVQKTAGMGTTADGPKTATEITNELKPQADRLHPISECAESIHKFILDSMIRVLVNNTHKGSNVNYGKRYMIEGPDVLWDKYLDAKSKGASISALDDLLNEYYEAKYSSDPVQLAIQQKMMKVEPFVHFTVDKVKALDPGENEYKAKLYFGEWLSTKNKAELLALDAVALRADLIAYSAQKTLKAPEPKQLPNAA